MVSSDEIKQFIRAEVDKDFFEELEILIPQTFQKACTNSQELLHTPQEHLRGQMRHSFVQDAVAAMARWSPRIISTKPKGHFYVLLPIGKLRLTTVVLPWQKDVRPAKHRSELKALNEELGSIQSDWISGLGLTVSEQLMHALVIVQAPPPSYSVQSEPLGIVLAVPYFNGKGFHMTCTLQDLLGGYSKDDAIGHKDLAWPKLRDKMRRAEEADEQADDEQSSKR